jgi:signal transduction histidine kinase
LIDAVRAAGSIRSQEVILRAKSGAAITGLLSATAISIGGRNRLITVVADITDRKRAEEALRESERLERLVAQASELAANASEVDELVQAIGEQVASELGVSRCGFSRVDLDAGQVLVMKDYDSGLPSIAGSYPIADYMEHWQEDGMAGRTAAIEDVAMHPRTAARYETTFAPIQVRAHLTVPLHRDGEWVANFWASHHEPRRWSPGEIKLMQLIGERVWAFVERKWAEEALWQANRQLLEADRRKNEFLAMLSHELRNPLAPIRNSVYILEHAAPGGEQAKRARQVIDRQVQHMARLIDDLLDITRISRGKIHLQREQVDLNALVRGTVEDQRDQYAKSGIALEVKGPAVPLYVDGDPTRLAQVFGNLLHNSVKFTPRGGRTVLHIEADAQGHAVVRVRDNGVGMSPETLAHLFEPFVQAAQTLGRTRGGLGLGLALVKGLVEMHGGEVTAHSEGEGKGAEFTVTLPLQPQAGPRPALTHLPGRPASARRVLVIEDNEDAAESLREVLELDDHAVTVAYSGPMGIEVARRLQPDVVLCDIGLPGMDGYGVARALRADPDPRLRSTFLVALSGYASQEDVTRSKEAGFDRHVAKPPSIEVLEKLIQEASAR